MFKNLSGVEEEVYKIKTHKNLLWYIAHGRSRWVGGAPDEITLAYDKIYIYTT